MQKIKWTVGCYEFGKYFNAGDEYELPNEKAALFIQRGHAEAVGEPTEDKPEKAAADKATESGELVEPPETGMTKHRHTKRGD